MRERNRGAAHMILGGLLGLAGLIAVGIARGSDTMAGFCAVLLGCVWLLVGGVLSTGGSIADAIRRTEPESKNWWASPPPAE